MEIKLGSNWRIMSAWEAVILPEEEVVDDVFHSLPLVKAHKWLID